MGGTERKIFFGILALLVLVAALYVRQTLVSGQDAEVYGISVILCGGDDNFEQGLNGAAPENNADVHIVTLTREDVSAQTAALERELKNGANAVILYRADAGALDAWLAKNNAGVPIVLVGDEAPANKNVSAVTLDVAALAETLVQELEQQPLRSVRVVYAGEGDAARYDALAAALEAAGFTFDLPLAGEVDRLVPGCVYIALNPFTAQALSELPGEGALLYGMGYGEALRGALENGRIRALVLVSEFDAGYLAMTVAVARVDGDRPADTLLSPVVARADNMYDPPVSTILFPIG